MRLRTRLSTLLAAAALLTGHVASAAQICARPADKAAFDVTGLKSELMVTALTCNAQDKYNAFVTQFRPELQTEDRALHGYFSRAYGRRGTTEHDDYITQLANVQSQYGLKDGTLFCQRNMGIFDEVLALHSTRELESYAAGKQLQQPVALEDCKTVPVVRKAAVRRVVHKKIVHEAAKKPVHHH